MKLKIKPEFDTCVLCGRPLAPLKWWWFATRLSGRPPFCLSNEMLECVFRQGRLAGILEVENNLLNGEEEGS